eukprot:COSAG04_NODE_1256_length_7539_cov_3.922581_2_plen_189_part_00
MSASRASRRLASARWAAALGLLAATARAEVVTVTDATWAETVGTGNSQWMVELCAPSPAALRCCLAPGSRAAGSCCLSGALLLLPGAPAPAPAPLPPRAGRLFSRRPGWRSYAPWCGHCKAFAPVWEEVAEKLGPSTGLKFAKVDATYEPESAGKFGVKSYPKIFFLDKSYAQDVRPAALAGRTCPRP